jgi:RND superfamily putative drug exporter
VSSNDLATFLPENAESTTVKNELEKFQDSSTIPLIVVFESDEALTNTQRTQVSNVQNALQKKNSVAGDISPPIVSDDKKAEFVVVPLDSEADLAPIITDLQSTVDDTKPSLSYKFTGPAMFSQDLQKAFAGIDGTLLLVALGVVFVILFIVYRSPVLPVVTLLGAMTALASAILLVWHLADAGIVQLNGQVQGILFILVIGAATDYSLLYIARYREELAAHNDAWTATKAAWKASVEPIVAAGGTVTLGLLCLLASDLGSNKALGPVGGIGIIFAVLIALTFLPAILLLFGRTAFWPRKPKYMPSKRALDYHDAHPAWAKVGALVGRHPRRLWVGILVLLAIALIGVPQLKAQGVSQENLILGASQARDGQAMLDRHFPSGSGSPTYVLVPEAQRDDVIALLDKDAGVDAVSMMTTDKNKSPIPVGEAADSIRATIRSSIKQKREAQLRTLKQTLQTQLAGAPQSAMDTAYSQATAQIPSVDELSQKADPFKNIQPRVIDGDVMLMATLRDPASSVPARETIQRLRKSVEQNHPDVRFGGVSAIQLDTNTASERDIRIIIPLILLAITIVLMLLLRAIIAPLLLLFTTVLSFGATIGISALLFNHVWNFAGADPSVVIFGFVFLVALGIDYNIFLMTRVREETMKLGVREGTLKALVVTGGVITSAGIVLAATFAALYVIPILFLAQIAFIVAFGVLLDTLVVRSLLVPALTLEVGRFMWWPSKLSRNKDKE